MAEWDLRPALNRETGLPQSFMEMPLDVHLELWSAAAAKLVTQSAHAALLVSMHGTALYRMRDLDRMSPEDAQEVRRFIREREAEQDELIERLGLGREDARVGQRLLWAWDHMSLALCLRWSPTTVRGVPLAGGEVDLAMAPDGDDTVTVDPWPFAGRSLTVRCEGRRLAGGYTDERELHEALRTAPLVPLTWELRRANV